MDTVKAIIFPALNLPFFFSFPLSSFASSRLSRLRLLLPSAMTLSWRRSGLACPDSPWDNRALLLLLLLGEVSINEASDVYWLFLGVDSDGVDALRGEGPAM